jgi:hypothetical protein
LLVHIAAFDLLDSSTWIFETSEIVNGGTLVVAYGLGTIGFNEVSSTGSTGPLAAFEGPAETSTTGTAELGSTILTVASGYGISPGDSVVGSGIAAGTRVAAVSDASVILSQPTGSSLNGTPVSFKINCFAYDVTQINTTSNGPAIYDYNASASPPCIIRGLAVQTDAGGDYYTQLTNAGTSITDSLELSYYTGSEVQRCITLSDGNALAYSVAEHNAVDGCYEDLFATNYEESLNNFFAQNGPQSITGQGAIFGFGTGCPWNGYGDIVVNDNDPGTYGVFFLNDADGVTANSPCPVIQNYTVVMGSGVGSNPNAVSFGEPNGPYAYPDVNVGFSNSIVIGSYHGIGDRDGDTTYLGNGTGSAGVYNNDVYGQTANPYVGPDGILTASGNHFDNGAQPHPSSDYGDTSFNPSFTGTVQYPSSPSQKWAICDAALGGVGAAENVFENIMFNRWTGAAPVYTSSQMVDCLRLPFKPHTTSNWRRAGYGGTFLGAIAPLSAVLSLNSSANPSVYNQALTLTWRLEPTNTGSIPVPATGTVWFLDGSAPLGSAPVISGTAVLSGVLLSAGSHSLRGIFSGDSNYSAGSTFLTQVVDQASPVLTWASPATIIFGSALGDGQLNATANTPGTFTYTPPAGTVLPVGDGRILSATFTPTDFADYKPGSISTMINVNSPNAQLVVTSVLSRDASNNVVVQLRLANTGASAAANVLLTIVKVGVDSGTPLPQSIGTIDAGGSAQVTVTVPGSVGPSGTASSLTVSGAYSGRIFSSSARITLP